MKIKFLLTASALVCSLPVPAAARDFTDCGAVDVISISSETGKILGKWTTPGLGVTVSPFLASPDRKAVYLGFETCHAKDGKLVDHNVLPQDGRLVPSSINLSLPDMRPEKTQAPNPAWGSDPISALPSSDEDAVLYFNKMLFYDKTESTPSLKIIDLQNKPIVHVISPPWRGLFVKDLLIGSHHAFVFAEERTLYCFDFSGNLIWTWSHDGPGDEAGPGVEIQIYEIYGRYLVAINHAGLYALDGATGKVLWRVKYYNIYASPSILKAGGVLVLGPASRPLF